MLLRQKSLCRSLRMGAHTVEFALVFPAFLFFIFGLVEIGRGMMTTTLLTNAARAGCRTGTLPGTANTDVTAEVDSQLKSQGISGYSTTIQVNGNSSTNVSSGQTGDTILVSVSVSASNVSWLPGAGYLVGNLSGNFSLPHE